ncbi:MAG TPA: hypothetical protein VFI70_02810 [Nitrososphaeraceae archaeon]|nr:hypothetical protein [Nitrososphaeraceae archaeon]
MIKKAADYYFWKYIMGDVQDLVKRIREYSSDLKTLKASSINFANTAAS